MRSRISLCVDDGLDHPLTQVQLDMEAVETELDRSLIKGAE